MRRAAEAWAVLACAAAAGCLGSAGSLSPSNSPHKASAFAVGGFGNAFGNAIAAERMPGLFVEAILFERPLGDSAIDRVPWSNTAAFLPPRTKTLLEENGLRAAILGGNLPPPFLRLLESKHDAIAPRRFSFVNRSDEVVPTLGPIEKCQYRVLTAVDGERETVMLKAATAGVLIRPARSADGRVTVYCEPQIQHGEREQQIRLTADGADFQITSEIPTERYSCLGFEAELSAGDYLVLGAPAASMHTLGSALFTVESSVEPRQRILVIRAGCHEKETPTPRQPPSTFPSRLPLARSAR